MESRNVLCKSIEWLKNPAGDRTFKKEFAVNMAQDIEIRGLLNPITVRPHPDKPEHYIGVAGRHRWYAVAKVLKSDLIEARIAAEMTSEDADMATTVENLWRSELTPAQHIRALKKWHADYAARNPSESESRGAAGGAANKARIEAEKAASAIGHDAAGGDGASLSDPPIEPSKPKPAGFSDMVAAATGKSPATAKREIRFAKMFSEEELETFEQMQVSREDMGAVAKVNDKAQRSEICVLIASGVEPKDAITKVTGDAAPAGPSGKPAAEAKAAAKAEKQPELTDDEWYELQCSEKAAQLADTTKFKADAILFRAVSTARHAFRAKTKNPFAVTKDAGEGGFFFWLVRRFLNVAHPKDWYICGDCAGQCKTVTEEGEEIPCKRCYGGGYQLKVEEIS